MDSVPKTKKKISLVGGQKLIAPIFDTLLWNEAYAAIATNDSRALV